MGDRLLMDKPSANQVDSAFHPSGVGKMRSGFGWEGKDMVYIVGG